MKKIILGLILILILPSLIFIACKKENAASGIPSSSSAVSSVSSSIHHGGAKSIGTWKETDAPVYNCPNPNGNCTGVVIIHGMEAVAHFDTPLHIAAYFNGTTWHDDINPELSWDDTTLDFLRSGNAHSYILTLDDRKVVFIGDENVSQDNYQFCMPIMN